MYHLEKEKKERRDMRESQVTLVLPKARNIKHFCAELLCLAIWTCSLRGVDGNDVCEAGYYMEDAQCEACPLGKFKAYLLTPFAALLSLCLLSIDS